MPRKRLILHIGTQKTGTSSFQQSLVHNRAPLIQQGVLPLLETKMFEGAKTDIILANVTAKAHLFIRPRLRTGARINKAVADLNALQLKTRRARLAKRLRNLPAQNVVMSAEAFSFLRTPDEQETLHDFLAQTDREVMTLVVFREEAAWRASWENQITLRAMIYDEIQSQPEEFRINADWYYDKAAIRAFWSPFNLTELCYEAHENIVEALFQAIGVSTSALKTDIRANTGKTQTPDLG